MNYVPFDDEVSHARNVHHLNYLPLVSPSRYEQEFAINPNRVIGTGSRKMNSMTRDACCLLHTAPLCRSSVIYTMHSATKIDAAFTNTSSSSSSRGENPVLRLRGSVSEAGEKIVFLFRLQQRQASDL